MKVRVIAFLSALLASSAPCSAQGTFEGWYQIEMIVYSRPQHNSVERWPKDIRLNYPLNWQQLYSPDSLEPEQTVDLQRTPFYRLPTDARNLNAISERLDAQPGFKVLFHEAWRQIVVDQKNSPSILVFGGKEFGEHQELEGSVTIHVSRYLHINTHLWLSQFQTNAGQNRNQWPTLPQQPQKRLAQQTNNSDELQIFQHNRDALKPAGAFNIADKHKEIGSALNDFLAAPYLPREIITMNQTRKMRSDELHYLDHPRMAVLIKILPYTPPKAAADNTAPLSTTPL